MPITTSVYRKTAIFLAWKIGERLKNTQYTHTNTPAQSRRVHDCIKLFGRNYRRLSLRTMINITRLV